MKDWNEIEKELKNDSQSLSFQFDDQYWDEMEQQLPVQPLEEANHAAYLKEQMPVFTFQEAYWDEVEQALDQKERRKRYLLYAKFTGGIAATVTFLWLALSWNSISLPDFSASTNTIKSYLSGSVKRNSTTHSSTPNSCKNSAAAPVVITKVVSPKTDRVVKKDHQIPSVNDNLSAVNKVTPDTDMTSELMVDEYVSLNQKELLADYLLTGEDYSISAPHPTKPHGRKRIVAADFYLTSGVSLAYAPKGNATDRTSVGLGTGVGIGYQMRFRRMAIATGVNIVYRNGINNELRYDREYYGARLRPYVETDIISYKALTRLEFPLTALIIRDKNAFGLGITPVYNASVNSTYQRFNTYNDDRIFVKNNFGIREGIKKYDVKVHCSYARDITRSLQVTGDFSAGLVNQIDRTIITNTRGYRDISFSISLKYNILRF